MVKPTLIKESPIAMFELRDELDRIKKRDGELNFRANKTEEYLNQFIEKSTKEMDELKKAIEKLNITRLKEDHIVKIVDLMPQSTEELKVILQSYVVTLTQEQLSKVIEITKNG